jgi:hypothetical protein
MSCSCQVVDFKTETVFILWQLHQPSVIIALLLTAAAFIIIFVEADGYVSDVRMKQSHLSSDSVNSEVFEMMKVVETPKSARSRDTAEVKFWSGRPREPHPKIVVSLKKIFRQC